MEVFIGIAIIVGIVIYIIVQTLHQPSEKEFTCARCRGTFPHTP